MSMAATDSIMNDVSGILGDLEALYKDVHQHPELSMQEERTAGIAAERLRAAGFDVTTEVGKTGVVGVLENGDGPTVMLRADMDALPVSEQTGLDYASTVDGVMHACGHDMHVAWLAGAAALLASLRDAWHGTLLAVFQPAEETAAGARAMIDDGLFDRFAKPDVILGQHVMPSSKLVPSDAKVVKAFNTTFAGTLQEGEVGGVKLDVLMAGDDAEAKRTVASLVEGGGMRAIDVGPLKRARQLEQLGLFHIAIQDQLGSGFGSALRLQW
jgi:metal-dependent amidase/aminoacylase/carboxypeptidase family protein